MQRLGKNHGGYQGERIAILGLLQEIESTARDQGWTADKFLQHGEFKWLALHRAASHRTAHRPSRVYISTGIHGDEPAGPRAVLRLLEKNFWPSRCDLWLCPCLNPSGFVSNRRENDRGIDLNRDYRHLQSEEIRAHIAWLERQPSFDVCLCLHEDWESNGFYVYELNPDNRPSLAGPIVAEVAKVCPIDRSEMIEGRPAEGGIIRPNLDPESRPQWPEAFWLFAHKTRLSYTLEAPSDFPLETRVNALVAGVNAALAYQLLV